MDEITESGIQNPILKFDNRTCLEYLNTGLVRNSDPHCIQIPTVCCEMTRMFAKYVTVYIHRPYNKLYYLQQSGFII